MGRDLDLDAIKDRLRIFEGREWIDTAYIANAASFVKDVPRLIAEIERLQRLAGADPSPSSDVYESAMQALADERARADQTGRNFSEFAYNMANLLDEILGHFPAAPRDEYEAGLAVRSGPVPHVTLARWRSHLRGGS